MNAPAEFPVELILTRGLPASGKTTWARAFVNDSTKLGRRVMRFNRDDFRRMALHSDYAKPEFESEKLITVARDCAVTKWLSAGVSVVIDDTNLRMKFARDLADLAARLGVGFRTVDFFDISLEQCIGRDAYRGQAGSVGFVGEHVIRDMHARYLASGHPGPVLPRVQDTPAVEPYVPNPDMPDAVMVDLDGTVALLNGRNPYDESCVSADLPNQPVIDVVCALIGLSNGFRLWRRLIRQPVFMSARTDGCRADTVAWLLKNIPGLRDEDIVLFMRKEGDTRPDTVVKLELFNSHVRENFNVGVVLDDRNSVVKLWRSMGLACLQVAEGDF